MHSNLHSRSRATRLGIVLAGMASAALLTSVGPAHAQPPLPPAPAPAPPPPIDPAQGLAIAADVLTLIFGGMSAPQTYSYDTQEVDYAPTESVSNVPDFADVPDVAEVPYIAPALPAPASLPATGGSRNCPLPPAPMPPECSAALGAVMAMPGAPSMADAFAPGVGVIPMP